MAWFSLVATWCICFDHSKRSSNKTPRYFTMSVCINLFPSRIILRLGSVFLELEWKIINSVFVTVRDNLLALSHWEDQNPFSLKRFLVNYVTEAYWCHQQNDRL